MLVAQVSLGEESKVRRGAHMSLGGDFEVDGGAQQATPRCYPSSWTRVLPKLVVVPKRLLRFERDCMRIRNGVADTVEHRVRFIFVTDNVKARAACARCLKCAA